MALALSELETLRDDLVRARSSGEARVSYGDKAVVYRSISEIEDAISSLDEDIAALKGEKKVEHRRHYVVKTGW